MKVYVVTMYRWGDIESHSYVHGVYSDKDVAIHSAVEEQEYRGGNKYFPEVLGIEINTPTSSDEDHEFETILKLKG